MEERKNEFERLPVKVTLKIFRYLPVPDLKQCEETCIMFATLVEEEDLLRSKCCIGYKGIIFSPQSAPAPPNNENRSRLGTRPGHFSPHLDRFLRDALQNPYCSTLKLTNFLWTNTADSPVTHSMFDSTKLLGFLESNPNIASKIEHLIYYNNFFHHTRLFVKMVSILPNLRSITAEESYDRPAFPESLSQHLTWKVAEDFDFDRPMGQPVVPLTVSEDAEMTLKNLTTLAVKNSFNEASPDGISYNNMHSAGMTLTPTAIQCMVKYAAQFCEKLVVLDLHEDPYLHNMVRFNADLKKILMVNAKTLRTLKVTTFSIDEVRTTNAASIQSNPNDPRTVYDKPRDGHAVLKFNLFMRYLSGQELREDEVVSDGEDNGDDDPESSEDEEEAIDDHVEVDDWDEVEQNELVNDEHAEEVQNELGDDQGAEEAEKDELGLEVGDEHKDDDEPAQQRPPPEPKVPWIHIGLNLKHLELNFHLALLPTCKLDSEKRKTNTAHLLEFLATQSQLEQFKFGQLCFTTKSTEMRSALLNRIFLTCPTMCNVSIDCAEQFLCSDEIQALVFQPGFTWLTYPLRFKADEIISQEESFMKLTEDRANWSFYYVNWEDLDLSLIHTRSMENLTKLHIAQPGVKENLRLKVKNCDLQKILSEAKCLKSLCLEQCDMKWVSDVGLTGLSMEACARLGGGLDTDSRIHPGELIGSSLSSLKDLRVVKLIGIGDRVTDISVQHAFCGMKLKSLVLSSPKFTDNGVTALGNNLKGCECWIVFR